MKRSTNGSLQYIVLMLEILNARLEMRDSFFQLPVS